MNAHLRDDRTIEVKDLDDALVVTFPNPDWVYSWYDWYDEKCRVLPDLLERSAHRAIVLDFQSQDLNLPCSFEAHLVLLHRRLANESRVLKFCNLGADTIRQFTCNSLIKIFHVYPTLEDALKSP